MTEPTKPTSAALQQRVHDLAAKPQRRATPQPLIGFEPDLDYVEGVSVETRRARTWTASIPSRFLHAELAHFDDQAEVLRGGMAEWAQHPRGRNLVLLGPVGTGKTHAAVAACRQPHFERGMQILFQPLVELLRALRPGGPPDTMEELWYADLLIIDDLGSEKPSEWTEEQLFAVTNRRWLEQRPTIATANIEPEHLAAGVGERVFSRLVGNDALVLGLGGHDRRRRHA